MLRAQVDFEDSALAALQEAFDKLPHLVADELRQTVVPAVRRRVKEELGRDPGPVVRPIAWASERQRRAFFATNGFGRGIPTRRTGAYQKGWHVRLAETAWGAAVIVYNDTHYAEFVGGKWQQPFHAATGWPYAPDRLDVISDEASQQIPFLVARVLRNYEGL